MISLAMTDRPRDIARYDKAVREKRLAAEMAQVRRETDQFVAQAGHAKRMQKAQEMQGDAFKLPEVSPFTRLACLPLVLHIQATHLALLPTHLTHTVWFWNAHTI